MTRAQYLKAIKNNIQSLTIDEQNEALQYYSDYFEDAGDDKKVMEELGTPEEVAKQIIEKFANVPVASKKENKSDDDESGSVSASGDALYYSFTKSQVKNIDFEFGAAHVVAIPGSKLSIESRGIFEQDIECRIDSNGTLIVRNIRKLNIFNFWSHSRTSRVIPRILITIPENLSVGYFKLTMDAGNFEAKDIQFSCEKGRIEVGAGNLVISKVNGKNLFLRCGMGNLKVAGVLEERTNIDCGMGSVNVTLYQSEEDCSYDAKVGLGTFRFNKTEKSGVSQLLSTEQKKNHFSVNTGMGSVIIKNN